MMQYTEIEAGLLKLLGMETDDKGLVEFAFLDAKETALNYCHLEEIPAGLKNTVMRMTIDIYRNENLGSTDLPARVSSIKLGDTSTSFEEISEEYRKGLLKNYKAQLNKYRKV